MAQADASSFDKNDYNRFEENYLPLYVADDDPWTAWTEGAPGDGTGQWIRMRFSSMKGATKVRLRIRNGYQKSHKLFVANERAKRVAFTLLPGNTTIEKELTDTEGWQEVVLEQPAGVLAGLEMKIGSVFPGTKYEDLCISDVQVFVTAETPDNPAYEKSVFEKVKKWRADRIEAANAFARAAKDRPLAVAASYTVERTENGDQAGRGDGLYRLLDRLDGKKMSAPERATLAETRGWLARDGAAFEAVTLGVGQTSRLPMVDGMCVPSLGTCEYDGCDAPTTPFDGLPLLTTDGYKLIETNDRPSVARVLDGTAAKQVAACSSKSGTRLAWAVRDKDDRRTRALLLLGCALVEGREGKYVSSNSQLLAYDVTGRLRISVTPWVATSYDWAPDGSSIIGGTYASIESNGTYKAATRVATATPAK